MTHCGGTADVLRGYQEPTQNDLALSGLNAPEGETLRASGMLNLKDGLD